MRVLAHPARLVARQTRPRLLRPRILFACAIPFRRTVVYADGPADGRAYEIIASDAGPSSSRSQHPFAEAEHEYDQDAAPYEPPIDAEPGKGFITTATPQSDYLPSPPTGPVFTPTTGPQHPFDTHAFVNYLESHGLDLETSQTVMEGTRSMIVERSARTRERMLAKEELENQAYLFKAALNELRTELSVRARNDGTALRTAAGAIRREVEGLEVKIKEDVQTMKHDIEMEMNNRKDDTRTEMKGFDMTIEEINNKFTISLGDLRTEIESAKWDATRRAISIIVLIVVSAVAVSLFTTEAPKPPPVAPAPVLRDVGVGTEEDFVEEELPLSDERLEKLLKDKVPEVSARPRRSSKSRKDEILVDRI